MPFRRFARIHDFRHYRRRKGWSTDFARTPLQIPDGQLTYAHCGGERFGKAEEGEFDAEERLWHELVLAGIGGRTIEEAKQKISYREFLSWIRYRNANGPLWSGAYIEQVIALFGLRWAQTKGVKMATGQPISMGDFMINAPKEPDVEGNPENVFELLKALAPAPGK